jgi:toxin CptA
VQFPIFIELRRSRFLVFLLLLFHSLAAACALALPWLLRLALLGLIGLSAWRSLQPSKIVGLRLSERGGLDCLLTGSERTTALLLPDSVVFNQLIVLRMRIGEARRIVSIPLLPDSMSAEQFRMLRLWLRWRGEPSEPVGKGV